MKKVLLIGILVLAIGSSIVSGTTARYTQDLGEKTAVVTTKTFNVNTTLNGEFTDFEISPKKGENKKKFKFSVVNYDVIGDKKSASEVALDVKFTLEVTNLNKKEDVNDLLKALEIEVESKDSHFEIKKVKHNEAEIEGKEGTIEGIASFKAGQAEKKEFSIEVEWDDDHADLWKKAQGDKVGMKLEVNAIQAN